MLQGHRQGSRDVGVRKALAPLLFDAALVARDTLLFVGLVGSAVVLFLALVGGA